MSTRTIKLKLLTQTALVSVVTSARTLGEFKADVTKLDIDWSATKLIDRASKASFEIDEAVLPAIDAVMFVMPTKSKAGASYQKELRVKIKELKDSGVEIPFNYTHATNSQMEAFLASIESPEETTETIILKPGKYTVVVEDTVEAMEMVELLDETTLDDVDTEAEQLKKLFK